MLDQGLHNQEPLHPLSASSKIGILMTNSLESLQAILGTLPGACRDLISHVDSTTVHNSFQILGEPIPVDFGGQNLDFLNEYIADGPLGAALDSIREIQGCSKHFAVVRALQLADEFQAAKIPLVDLLVTAAEHGLINDAHLSRGNTGKGMVQLQEFRAVKEAIREELDLLFPQLNEASQELDKVEKQANALQSLDILNDFKFKINDSIAELISAEQLAKEKNMDRKSKIAAQHKYQVLKRNFRPHQTRIADLTMKAKDAAILDAKEVASHLQAAKQRYNELKKYRKQVDSELKEADLRLREFVVLYRAKQILLMQ